MVAASAIPCLLKPGKVQSFLKLAVGGVQDNLTYKIMFGFIVLALLFVKLSSKKQP